eukprot:TRINITY_DN888_c0_g1_i1.p1 TRINITY_DN888_c0_g1~~TRINITY_DN888_c0_g1_i1.p1  ORF type:complete len:206 (-),score=56.70 TRINITY_DN888_c0_g1_i1:85-702(-)
MPDKLSDYLPYAIGAGAVAISFMILSRFFSTKAPAAASRVIMGKTQQATFGGGCFWGMEKWFKSEFPGVHEAKVGYAGGTTKNPTYEEVCTGKTNHAEVLRVLYDEDSVNYEDLVKFFFRMHDPTTLNRQGNDRGTQYRSVIYYYSPEQEASAKKVKDEMQASGNFKDPIVTEITAAPEFYEAEAYHQKYLERNPGGYCNHKIRF